MSTTFCFALFSPHYLIMGGGYTLGDQRLEDIYCRAPDGEGREGKGRVAWWQGVGSFCME